jgi:stalled ribosome rescue protein Dom34
MKSKVVYVTSDEAQVFTLKESDFETQIFRKQGPRHHTEPAGHHQLKKNDDTEHFLHELAVSLEAEPSRILLVGPAQAKTRLNTHIQDRHPELAKNIVGIETMDKATNPQIVAFARKFFTKLNVYS